MLYVTYQNILHNIYCEFESKVNEMGNLPGIEDITNGLLTLQKIKRLYHPEARTEGEEASENVHPDKLSLTQEILSAITNFIPQTRGASYSTAFSQGQRYSSAYRELKHHIRSMNRSTPDHTQIIEGLKLVTPILGNRQKLYVDKVVKIVEILQS